VDDSNSILSFNTVEVDDSYMRHRWKIHFFYNCTCMCVCAQVIIVSTRIRTSLLLYNVQLSNFNLEAGFCDLTYPGISQSFQTYSELVFYISPLHFDPIWY
jgi:hypothetical protein